LTLRPLAAPERIGSTTSFARDRTKGYPQEASMNRQSWRFLAAVVFFALAAFPAFGQRPDIELKGITVVGVVVEDLSPQAAACGLNHDAIQSAASKILTDSGLKVVRDSDNDTYVYLNIITTSIPTGLCVSRYDAYLYTHTTAKLSYQDSPVLVQVSLIHEAGLAGGAASGHGDNVVRALKQYVEQFAARIRRANQ